MKADVEEILIYAAADDLGQAVAQVQQAGTAEVLITRASQGSTVYGPGGRIEVPAVPPRPLVDATGCGDTYLAAYLARRLESDDLADCGAFAAAAATIKMEASGPFRGSADEIARRRAALQAGGRRRGCCQWGCDRDKVCSDVTRFAVFGWELYRLSGQGGLPHARMTSIMPTG
jgi:bifunctional ADP-heptose synthase (sugar kinase/adenylyltransferase)